MLDDVTKVRWHDPVGWAVRASGRSWWQAHYAGGRVINEWDTPPGAPKHPLPDATAWRQTRWEDVPKRGMTKLVLFCPNGMAAVCETSNPEGRLIQFKNSYLAVGFGMPSERQWLAQVIGNVADDGTCLCWAWERAPHAYRRHPYMEDARCVTCGLLSGDCSGRDLALVTGEHLVETVPDPAWPERVERTRITDTKLVGRQHPLVKWADNVFNMRYRNVGALFHDVQGLRL